MLYLTDSSIEGGVVSWSLWDGTGREEHMAGDSDDPPYRTGLDALKDGWRLIQMSQLMPPHPGAEFTTSYQRYEFLFEKLVDLGAAEEGTSARSR